MNTPSGPGAPFRRIAAAGAFSACAAVALGAFGAHGLRQTIPPDMLAVYETGVRYQMYHALGLIAAGLAGLAQGAAGRRLLGAAAWAFAIGTLLFSGSLYGLALTGIRWLGAVTPAGGLAFLAGWALLGLALLGRGQS
ncbi:MAG TPA: DUF423 domain-containing protein [Bacteroidota bacterium]|nr:DUF423 domain-containing protein [Bacteroidota bacterium]